MSVTKKSAAPHTNGRHPELSTAVEPVAAPKKSNLIEIPPFNFVTVPIKIIGVSGLICNAFPDKEKKRMLEIRTTDESVQEETTKGKNRKPRPARDFHQEYLASLYPIPEIGYGFPAVAFKRAIVGACRQVSMLDMTMANRILFVKGPYQSKGFEVVKITGKPRMIETMVRLQGQNKPPDVRYRGEFHPWSAILEIEFNASRISVEGVYRLIQFAGKCEGVGESRPSSPVKSGNNGQFRLAEKGE